MPLLTPSEWDSFLSNYPDAHLLQTTPWGELKAAFGWEVVRLGVEGASGRAGAQLLLRSLPLGYRLAYLPKGPVGGIAVQAQGVDLSVWEALWLDVDALCRQKKAIFLKVEPDLWEGSAATPAGFQSSAHAIQPPRTLLVDLCGSEEEILGRMKQKTRYNLRLAQKKGVVVAPSADLDLFYRLMQATGQRDQFGVHSLAYYQRAYELFHPRGACQLLLAEFEGEPLAALMAFAQGRRAWYLYGASTDAQRERMPSYILQWEAIRWARAQGCTIYDLWGVPDADEETLETNFTQRSDGLWGVYRFKRGFGGHLRRTAGPWDRVYQPVLYAFYQWLMRRGIKE